ncbi:Hypothetical protein NCS54_00973600 [Fusarium falciforme]|uniref:Hypothetical protein n=1 Tax=Fusarium falciforme TaxID=195108 RepID=UPI0023014412|nr:Hypothetical protein NCS54_00973600 [Fusarium falciforme]WAO92237.1 Hypothetical protein NCS54_00973600 [Fusarium falciforme]
MAALLRSQDALDLETAIREWQSRQNEHQHGGLAQEPDEKSAAARLTAALDTLFREIVVILSDKGKFPRDIFISLDRSRSCFSLWSDGHGVASGSLDDKFQRSRKLRQATMKTLSHLSSTLIDRLVPAAHISNPKTKGLCDQVSNILEEVNFSHVADDSSSDSTSEYSTADVHELAEDLKTDVDCLIELDQMIRDPATDPEPEMTEANVSLSSWAPHQVFANKVEHRFPAADAKLFSSLGMVNYQRYLRCQIERDRNQVHAEQPEQIVEVTAGSKFHDSGLGSSLNPESSYAETIMSYRDGNRSIRIPPLPEEAKRGEAFPCVACGRSVIITTNSQWKRHLYIDLQPYVCLDTSCQRSDSTFSNRANWLQHLALDHGMEPSWEQIECPLCGDEAGPGKITITTHLGRHLEEISLSALPVAPDSETNSEASESDIDNSYRVNQDDEEEPQDLGLAVFGSEGELSDQTSNILSVQSWKSWEDLIDATNREAAGGATGDQPPILSDYLASPSVRPAAGDEALVKYLQARPLERQLQRDIAMQQEKRKETVELSHEPEVQIHNVKEAAFHRRMGEMKTAQEEAKREIEKSRIEAEEAAYQRLKAEQKAEEEERARLYAQAIAAAEEAAYKRIKAERAEEDRLRAELKVMEARRQSEAEIRDRVETEARAKMLEIEEAHRRQMKDMKAAQAEAKREIEKAKVEAEKAARERLVAERKAEEERSRKYAEAMAAVEENARLRFEAELKAAESRQQVEAEARDRADEEAMLKLEAAVKAGKDHREAEAEAITQSKEAQKKYYAERTTDMSLLEGEEEFLFPGEEFNLSAQSPKQQAPQNLLARAARISEQQREAVATQAEKEGRDKVEVEAWLKLDDTVMATSEERAREHVEDKVVSDSPRQEVSDRNAGVEHDQRLEDWQTRHWRWICPSCGSEDQDRRKGPVCSNCSYLVGDGDGFEASVPEQRQPREDEVVTEEQFQKQHQGSPKHQPTFTSLERAPQAAHQYSSKHAGQSIPDTTTNNDRNAPINGPEHSSDFLPQLSHPGPGFNYIEKHNYPGYIPRELDLMEPHIGIDNHTAVWKKKLNPIRLNTAANHPLSGLDSNDPPVLPPIQLGNAKGIHTTIPSLNEDTGLVDGFRDADRDWSLITDLAEQRRRANRMAQRAYREKLKRRLEDLERRAGAADGQGSDQSGTSKDGLLNDIPTSPAQRSLGSARDRNRDPDVDREISYESDHDTSHPRGHDFPTAPQESAPREHETQVRQKLPAGSSQRADDSDQWQQSDHRSLSTEPPSLPAAPGLRTTSHTRERTPSSPCANQDSLGAFAMDNLFPNGPILGTSEYPIDVTRLPSPTEYDGSSSHHTPRTDAPFNSVRGDDDDLEDESWPFGSWPSPRPL